MLDAPRLYLACLVVITISGCVSLSAPTAFDWKLAGKLSVRTPQESRIMVINWRKAAGAHKIDLLAPLGMSVAQVLVEGNLVTVTSGDKVRRVPGMARLPLENNRHVDIPITPVLNWMDAMAKRAGETPPAIPGWSYEVRRWKDNRPALVQFDAEDVSLRLKVSRWTLQSGHSGE